MTWAGHTEWALTLLLNVVQFKTGFQTKLKALSSSPKKEHGRHRQASSLTEYPNHCVISGSECFFPYSIVVGNLKCIRRIEILEILY